MPLPAGAFGISYSFWPPPMTLGYLGQPAGGGILNVPASVSLTVCRHPVKYLSLTAQRNPLLQHIPSLAQSWPAQAQCVWVFVLLPSLSQSQSFVAFDSPQAFAQVA